MKVWVTVGAVIAALGLAVAFDWRGDEIRALREDVDSYEAGLAAAREQVERQRQIILEHGAYLRSLEGGGDEGLSDYLHDGADRLWGAE